MLMNKKAKKIINKKLKSKTKIKRYLRIRYVVKSKKNYTRRNNVNIKKS